MNKLIFPQIAQGNKLENNKNEFKPLLKSFVQMHKNKLPQLLFMVVFTITTITTTADVLPKPNVHITLKTTEIMQLTMTTTTTTLVKNSGTHAPILMLLCIFNGVLCNDFQPDRVTYILVSSSFFVVVFAHYCTTLNHFPLPLIFSTRFHEFPKK